ncbi:MAG: GAF domain-containing protein [Alphaproteobacteria bacterium]|nr:GAF domain-containing protein [Alphaproteobacteria bacterium]
MTLTLDEIRGRVLALCEGEDDAIALMATMATELFHGVDGFDWVGFYRVTAPGMLKIGPYQGGHGCLQIPFDRGVCGASASRETTLRVDDVDAFPGHIACAASTKSELVVRGFDASGTLIAVLDLDSDTPAFFTAAHQEFIENLVADVFGQITA